MNARFNSRGARLRPGENLRRTHARNTHDVGIESTRGVRGRRSNRTLAVSGRLTSGGAGAGIGAAEAVLGAGRVIRDGIALVHELDADTDAPSEVSDALGGDTTRVDVARVDHLPGRESPMFVEA